MTTVTAVRESQGECASFFGRNKYNNANSNISIIVMVAARLWHLFAITVSIVIIRYENVYDIFSTVAPMNEGYRGAVKTSSLPPVRRR